MPAPVITFHKSTRLPRLLVTDLDGTLLNPQHTISLRSITALSLAQSFHSTTTNNNNNNNNNTTTAPIQIMIASGRSPRSIQKVIDLFGGVMTPDAVICCNGALNYNPRTKTISVPQFMPLDQARQMVSTLRNQIHKFATKREQVPAKSLLNPDEYLLQSQAHQSQLQDQVQMDKDQQTLQGRPGFACEVIYFLNPFTPTPTSDQPPSNWVPQYAQDTSFVCDKVWEHERKHSIYYDYTSIDNMEDFITSLAGRGGIVKLMALDRNRTASAVYESLPDPLVHHHHYNHQDITPTTPIAPTDTRPPLTLTYSGPYFLEISGAGVNKGLGLSAYCAHNSIPREEVVAFGDLLNDAEMLQFAGLGLCMGNGHEDMKRLADRVIGTNAEDGLAKEVESWFA